MLCPVFGAPLWAGGVRGAGASRVFGGAPARDGLFVHKRRFAVVREGALICPKSAPIAVSKTDNVKIITPEANQFADAWDIDYRKYHDLFVPENKRAAVAVSISE